MNAESPVEVRRLGVSEWRALRSIRLRALAEAPAVYGTTLDQETDRPETFWRARLTNPLGAVFGGFASTEAVALAGLRRHAGGNVLHRCEIWGVFVAPEVRGAGVAKKLIGAVLDHAGAWTGVETVELNVRADNDAAIRLYDGLGFRRVGVLPDALKRAGRYGDELIMLRGVG
jgi:RimJ/RimL family protein N-acetyltransferase